MMNKRVGILIICAAILVLCFVGTVSAKTWYVDDDRGAGYTRIVDAVGAANVRDTFIVNGGTHYDNVDEEIERCEIGDSFYNIDPYQDHRPLMQSLEDNVASAPSASMWEKHIKTGVNEDYLTYIPTPDDFGEYAGLVDDNSILIPNHIGDEQSIVGFRTWVYVSETKNISIGINGDDSVGLYCDGKFICGSTLHEPMSYGAMELSTGWHRIEALVYNGPTYIRLEFDKKLSNHVDAMTIAPSISMWEKHIKTGVNEDYLTYIPTPDDFGEYAGLVEDDSTLIPNHIGDEWSIVGFRTWVYVSEPKNISIGINGDDSVGLYCDGKFICGNILHEPMSYGTMELSTGWHRIEALVYNGPTYIRLEFDKKLSNHVDAMTIAPSTSMWEKHIKTGVNEDYLTYIPTPDDFGEYAGLVDDNSMLIPNHIGDEWSIVGFRTWVYVSEPKNISIGINGDDSVGLYCDGKFICGSTLHEPMSYGAMELSTGWHKVEALVYNGPTYIRLKFDKKLSNHVDAMTIAPPAFDTGEGTYPSIRGTHNGTITPSNTMIISKLYTYPCAGTGGHTEHVLIANNTGFITAEADWDGYQVDGHTISFDDPFTLLANETYNYTIRTGSYPQIIHADRKTVAGGTITCDTFVDTNGNEYDAWIPAIRLGK